MLSVTFFFAFFAAMARFLSGGWSVGVRTELQKLLEVDGLELERSVIVQVLADGGDAAPRPRARAEGVDRSAPGSLAVPA